MAKDITLRILLQSPVKGTMYGLQKGKGSDYEIVQAQLGKGQDITFDFTVQLKETKGSTPMLTGPYVQGPAGNRFVYIVIGSYARQIAARWSGRLKVPLSDTTSQIIGSEEGIAFWYSTVPCRTEDGKPVFATVKPFKGWFRGKHSDQAGA